MEKIKYFTLASVRAKNPTKFDKIMKEAFLQAAFDVGNEVLTLALCEAGAIDRKSKKAA